MDLSSAARRPVPDLLTKAAALLQSVVNNHALVDGNKRLGWLATAVFLELNGIKASRASNDAIYSSTCGSPRSTQSSTKSSPA